MSNTTFKELKAIDVGKSYAMVCHKECEGVYARTERQRCHHCLVERASR
ncbi:hypothetical protein PC129_g13332 [Phytophthora cactorum]|uniref:Uncharacterized protein n=1 Tax=Phytophthora cactorum TaxID=29920 RepID=A0A329RS84_9STRA|nr:hypothetical protein PC112_g15404 [Phytophthora cactorum]KAG2813514.1 hypothetical protein PC111_g14358 [Phytophthora cactorum]KAG2855079.1 hypothetical protein PC113_g12739 [Phytophthora cactorum]KAG2901069.1 hypothetical protein PC114_g13323 [Phytophthora cactorum]KAG2914282.1 hypothetical protein PC115_g11703 [Phytophthora cactorum]